MKPILILTFVALSASSLPAQDSVKAKDSASSPRAGFYRDPRRARVLGTLIPGAGLFYASEYFRGYMAFVGSLGGISLGGVIYKMDGCTFALFALFNECNPNPKWPYEVAGALLVASGVWTWFSSARDAPRAAELANASHNPKAPSLSPIIEPSPITRGQWNAGVAVRW
jgi:hypothetical protein